MKTFTLKSHRCKNMLKTSKRSTTLLQPIQTSGTRYGKTTMTNSKHFRTLSTLVLMCQLILTGCSIFQAPPTQVVFQAPPIPPGLLAPIPIENNPINTYRDVVARLIEYETAVLQCNVDRATLLEIMSSVNAVEGGGDDL